MSITNITSKQRQLSSELSLEAQISNLKSLINNPPQNSRVCEFTPEIAQYILENLNINNRPRKTQKIIQYKKDMQENNWSLTGEAIKFGTDGFLKDGQNRLAACLQAQTPFTTHTVFGIDPETFHHMDTGKNRAADDVLSIMGVKSASKIALTIKFLLNWEAGGVDTSGKITNQQVKDAYLTKYDPDLLQEGVSWGQRVYAQTRYPMGTVAATFCDAVMHGYREEVENFLIHMMNGTGKVNSGPVKIMKHINFMRNNRIPIPSVAYSILLNRALHCYMSKKSMTNDMLNVTFADRRIPYPSK